MKARETFWYLGHIPYPFDRDTASAIEEIAAHYIIPWGYVDYSIEEWVYDELQSHEVEKAMPPLPALAELRAYRQKQEQLAVDDHLYVRGEEFVDACDILRSMIEVLPLDTPVRRGTFVQLPYLPLGRVNLSRVPLIDGQWIDRSVIELCEACAYLHDEGFTRMPPLDYHRLAWHRFYPPGTSWASPQPAEPALLFDARDDAERRLGQLQAHTTEINGRPYICYRDYAAWERRRVPGDLTTADLRGAGLKVCSWNAWIDSFSEQAPIKFLGERLGRLEHPFPVNHERDFIICDDVTGLLGILKERCQALSKVIEIARSLPSALRDPSGLTDRQHEILDALDGKALTKEKLARKIVCNPVTLYRPGGIKELQELGHVKNSRRMGGFYRPDRPPPLRSAAGKNATERN
jgi:hypothetical protein